MQQLAGWTGFPRSAVEFEERFRSEEACYAYLVVQRWPEGFRLPTVQPGRSLDADPTPSSGMQGVRPSSLGHRGYGLSPDEKATAVVVQGDASADLPAFGDLSSEPEEAAGAWELPDGVDLAAQASASDGETVSRTAWWPSRGR
jgi:hypothetical protein